MEIKKSRKADLERSRPYRIAAGLLIAVACFFVALEYPISPDDPLEDPFLLDQIESEIELPPMLQQENEMVLAPMAEPKPETHIVVVEEEEMEPDPLQEEQDIETDVADDMEMIDGDVEMEAPPPPDDDVVSLRVVEEMPQFPGGPVEFMKWLTRNLKYPPAVQQQQLQGRVVAEFIVGSDGSVTDVKILTSLHPQCDNEVLRVLRMMPRWTPGIDKGEPCRTKVCIPVVFKL
ncbi:MAG: energy transducer TonB [Prevotella sp.]|nr:energy transducer TonB [Prevotella sp.]